MKIVLLLALFMTTQAFACPINLKIEKNQTTYSLEDLNKFVRKLTLNRYEIKQENFKYLISIRLAKRSSYHEPENKIAMVSVDVYDSAKNLISHSQMSGFPSTSGSIAYSLLQYEKALIELVRELPRCN